MTLNEALAIIKRDTANGRIGAALRANSPQALELVAIRWMWMKNVNLDKVGVDVIKAVQAWVGSSIGAKGE